MATLNQSNFDDLTDRVTELESLMTDVQNTLVSINQVSALARLYRNDQDEIEERLDVLEAFKSSMTATIDALKRWRTDIRNELRYETATNVSGNTWAVSEPFDPDQLVIVFSGVVRALPAQITYDATSAALGRFTSSIALTSPVTVVYMTAIG